MSLQTDVMLVSVNGTKLSVLVSLYWVDLTHPYDFYTVRVSVHMFWSI